MPALPRAADLFVNFLTEASPKKVEALYYLYYLEMRLCLKATNVDAFHLMPCIASYKGMTRRLMPSQRLSW